MRSALIPRRVWLVVLLTVTLTTLPYLVALMNTPAGSTFSGAILDRVDLNSHLAKMQQGFQGAWRYHLLFTDQPHDGIFIQTFYVALGHIARWSSLSLILTYHLARILCTALMVLALWLLISHYLAPDPAWWALLLCVFGGGAGYLLFIFASAMVQQTTPIEFWLLDGYTFLGAFAFPHFAAGIALLAITFWALDRWTADGTHWSLLILWLASFAVGIVQPFDLLLIDLVLILAVGIRLFHRRIRPIPAIAGLALIGIAHATLTGYTWIALHSDSVWQAFNDQNITLSPPPIYYLLGYLPLLLPTIAGLWLIFANRITPSPLYGGDRGLSRYLIPFLWLLTAAILLYVPIAPQRRFILGIEAPLAIFAVYWLTTAGIPRIKKWLPKRYRLLLIIYGAAAILTTLALFAWLMVSSRSNQAALYDSAESAAAWNWIDIHTPLSTVFLANFDTGGSIVANTGRRVVLGHWIETPDYQQTLADVDQFFSDASFDRKSYLAAHHVDYVWYDGGKKTDLSFLTPVFESGTVTLYQVNP